MSFGIGEKICDGKLEGVVAKPRDEDDGGGEDLIHPDDYTGCVHTHTHSLLVNLGPRTHGSSYEPMWENPRSTGERDGGEGTRRGGGGTVTEQGPRHGGKKGRKSRDRSFR